MASSRSNPAKSTRARRRRSRTQPNERYAERRDEIVDIAAEVFAERGFHATTIDDLVDATGLQRGGLYHYMDSKEDLLIRIHERFIEPLLAGARELEEAREPADVTLRRLGHVLMNDIADYLPQVTVFLHEWRIIEHDPRWRTIRQSRRAFEDIVLGVMERGVEEGIFEIEDTRLTMLAFLGMFNYAYQWFRPSGRVNAEQLADLFCDAMLNGIRKPE